MTIGVISAMDSEHRQLAERLQEKKVTGDGNFRYAEGMLGGNRLVLTQCGIGKVNAALNAAAMINSEKPDLIINTGVAGGADLSMHICDVLVADGVAYHDVWCGPGTEHGQACGYPRIMRPGERALSTARKVLTGQARFGLICSGDRFICKEEEVAEIKRHFPEALAVDMESAAIAQTAMRYDIPFMILRAISDTPGSGENIEQYEDFWRKAPRNTFSALVTLLEAL